MGVEVLHVCIRRDTVCCALMPDQAVSIALMLDQVVSAAQMLACYERVSVTGSVSCTAQLGPNGGVRPPIFLYSSQQDLQARMQSSYLFETLNSDVMQFSSICVSVMLSSAEDIRESTSN